MSGEHRPTVLLQADVFPEDSFLLDSEDAEITPWAVAVEAWSNIMDWAAQGYQPIVTVLMPDGSEHTIDLEKGEDEQ